MNDEMKKGNEEVGAEKPGHFIHDIIDKDLEENKNNGQVHTRFPPEPNGFLHIGHAKSICLNFGTAIKYNGLCNLRFDDTNPTKEETKYVDSIREDVKWLGFDWEEREYYASDYFDRLYEFALALIKKGKAYVCDLNSEQIREYRGTLTEPGEESPYRYRSVEENLKLFEEMKNGVYQDGEKVLRAKIDMASPNLNMRDPVIYRVLHREHHRVGDKWCIYPMYDFTHCLSDAIEGITHSICTLEFEDHRPLYDWVLDEAEAPCHPQQIEFARLNLSYTIMSKRKLLELVEKNIVDGWDDPRMPTLAGMRRRGFTAPAIRKFCELIGVAKRESMVDYAMLEYCLREDLNKKASRVMGVLHPLKIVLTNYPEGKTEELDAVNNPEDESMGTRKIPFGRELYIERDDFMENPPRKFFRLSPGKEIRLKHAYYITCNEVIKDETTGEIIELRCVYDPETKGGWSKDGRKVKGTSHWVAARAAVPAEIRIYDHLFTIPDLGDVEEGKDWLDYLNRDSLQVITGCLVEPSLKSVLPGKTCQFLRQGYFCADSKDCNDEHLVFNKVVSLKDTWAKIKKNMKKG